MYVVNQTFNVDSVYIKEELSTYFNKKVYYMNIYMFAPKWNIHIPSHIYTYIGNTLAATEWKYSAKDFILQTCEMLDNRSKSGLKRNREKKKWTMEINTSLKYSGLRIRVRVLNSIIHHLNFKTLIPREEKAHCYYVMYTFEGWWMQRFVGCHLTLDPKACNFNIVSTVKRPVNRAFI